MPVPTPEQPQELVVLTGTVKHRTDGHSKSFTDSPPEPLGNSQSTVPPNSKSPLGCGFFWFGFRCLFVFKSKPEDSQITQSELSNTAAV